jgi:hypothetical protein
MADDTITDALKSNATGPAEASGDQGSMKQHNLRDQIEADRYLASKAATRGPRRGFVVNKIRPGSAVD